ncbi:SDH family Clp fold serine proteinase [Mesorhizobium shangrilense]|uniref:Serine dehydrogenasease n=1 Tax=Mesorhizobium shangrilense TaxID=460060 RepID=A0ABV2DMB9_9HYPH
MNESNQTEEQVQPVAIPPRAIEKTPMFTAMNAARYQRQTLIREIESTEPTLLCYIAGNKALVDRLDTLGFVDMLHNVTPGEPIDLMLHTPGGDVDAAEKLIGLVRSAAGAEGQLRVIIPDYAKSAGTLMALGANIIVMSESSELGPIDPQVSSKDGNGSDVIYSVLTYLNAYEFAGKSLREAPDDLAARITFEKFDPTIVRKFQSVRDRAKSLAEKLLRRQGKNFSKITSELMDINKYPSHGQMVGWETAKEMDLTIEYMSLNDPVWRRYWALYCHLRLAIEPEQRIFESNYVSLIM